MTQPIIEPAPDLDEIRQDPPAGYEMHVVPVCVEGITLTQVLPARRALDDSKTLVVGIPQAIITRDPRIRRAILSFAAAGGGGVILGTEQQVKAPNGPFGFPLVNGYLPLEGFEEETWAVATTATQTIGIRFENWAD